MVQVPLVQCDPPNFPVDEDMEESEFSFLDRGLEEKDSLRQKGDCDAGNALVLEPIRRRLPGSSQPSRRRPTPRCLFFGMKEKPPVIFIVRPLKNGAGKESFDLGGVGVGRYASHGPNLSFPGQRSVNLL